MNILSGVSSELRWNQEGVAILGSVPISTGQNFFKFPLGSHTYPFLRGTTSTAMQVFLLHAKLKANCWISQSNYSHWIPG